MGNTQVAHVWVIATDSKGNQLLAQELLNTSEAGGVKRYNAWKAGERGSPCMASVYLTPTLGGFTDKPNGKADRNGTVRTTTPAPADDARITALETSLNTLVALMTAQASAKPSHKAKAPAPAAPVAASAPIVASPKAP